MSKRMNQSTVREKRLVLTHPPVSQTTLAIRAGISLVTLRNAEQGRPVRWITAHSISTALNAYRQEQGLPPDVTEESLGLSWVH